MASDYQMYSYDGDKSFTLLKWKIRVGCQLLHNSVLLSYKYNDLKNSDSKEPLLKYKSNIGGTVRELLVCEGDIVLPGAQLLKFEPCKHPVIMKDLCAECGADLRTLDKDNFAKLAASTTFSMVHVVPELKVCFEQAEKLGRDDESRLLKDRKLVLLVDLDQTLIHTTNENVPKHLPDVHHFQLYGANSPWYHTKLRPGTLHFLKNISKYFELHICTFGARLYAHKIANILDPHGQLFSHRILSRDECFDATSKTGNLKALFPRGDNMVCIIDDREDVWNYAPNVVHVKPYCYFTNTGDINAPPICLFPTLMEENYGITPDTEQKILGGKGEESMMVSNNKSNENLCSTPSTINEIENHMEDSSTSNNGDCDDVKKSNATLKIKDEKLSNHSKETNTSEESKGSSAIMDTFPKDDYLLYLEDTLTNIHKRYYEAYDDMRKKDDKKIPDLKVIVPTVRKKTLKGCNIVFSSVIPTNLIPETSHFWILAESLGAQVMLDLVLDSSERRTTHVVSSKLGTAKVNAAKKHSDIYIVSIDWLFSCSERWERTDERLFPLNKDIVPPFLDGHKLFSKNIESNFYDPVTGFTSKTIRRSKRSHSSRKKKSKSEKEDEFTERVFLEAGLSLSQDDIEDMDREIDEACSEESNKESANESLTESSDESLSSGDYPKGWKKPRMDVPEDAPDEGEESSDAETIGSVDEEMAEAVNEFKKTVPSFL